MLNSIQNKNFKIKITLLLIAFIFFSVILFNILFFNPVTFIFFLLGGIFLFVSFFERFQIQAIKEESAQKAKKLMVLSAQSDPLWQKEHITQFVQAVFNAYYFAWYNFNPHNLDKFLSSDFYKKTILEMNVVRSLNRRFTPKIKGDLKIEIIEAEDKNSIEGDTFTAELTYSLERDSIFKTNLALSYLTLRNNQKLLYWGKIVEYWQFTRSSNGWRLNKVWSDHFIRPKIATPKLEEKIQIFAKENNFYYDPDFGKIIVPSKGKLFDKYKYSTRVSNHTIGVIDKKIVQFYIFYGCDSTGDNRTCRNYVISQAILPKNYKNMIIESKGSDLALFSNIGTGLEKIKTSSIDFDKKYTVYRHHQDRVNVLELLPTNFMEHLLTIKFPIYLEIVDNLLYIATPYRGLNKNNLIGYQEMLEVLNWSFKEMKM